MQPFVAGRRGARPTMAIIQERYELEARDPAGRPSPDFWNDAFGRRHNEVLDAILSAVSLVRDRVPFGNGGRSYGGKEDDERFGLEEGVEPQADPAEPWEPPLPESPLGPEGVPKEEDPGPDA